MRIYIVDDHSLFRDGLISLLEADGHQVVGQAGDGLTAVESVPSLLPDLILMDNNMPRMNLLARLSGLPHGRLCRLLCLRLCLDDARELADAYQQSEREDPRAAARV